MARRFYGAGATVADQAETYALVLDAVSQADTDGSEAIDRAEFSAWYTCLSEGKALFARADARGAGKVQGEELSALAELLARSRHADLGAMSVEDVMGILDGLCETDANGDEAVDFGEFMTYYGKKATKSAAA